VKLTFWLISPIGDPHHFDALHVLRFTIHELLGVGVAGFRSTSDVLDMTVIAVTSVDVGDYNVTISSTEISIKSSNEDSSSLINFVETLIIALVSGGIILSNIVNLTVLLSASHDDSYNYNNYYYCYYYKTFYYYGDCFAICQRRDAVGNSTFSHQPQRLRPSTGPRRKTSRQKNKKTVYDAVEHLRPSGWCHRLCTCCATCRHWQVDIRCDYLAWLDLPVIRLRVSTDKWYTATT